MERSAGVLVSFVLMSGLYASPRLELNSTATDFGVFPANQIKNAEFTLTNTGDELLNIYAVRSTCGCAVGKLDRTELPPGESAGLIASIVPESIAGPFAKALFIQSNDPSGLKTIILRGNSIPLITVKPQPLVYTGLLTAGQKWRHEFLLESSQPVKFGNISITGLPGAEVTIAISPNNDKTEKGFSTAQRQNSYIVTVNFTPDGGVEQFRGSIRLQIEHPIDWKPLELLIYGKVTAE